MLANNVHLKKGLHNAVLTEHFYQLLLTDSISKECQQRIINDIKLAYDKLNQYNAGVQFELCTNVPSVATEYSIRYVDSIDTKNDIVLDLQKGKLEVQTAAALTHWDYDSQTRELKDLKITYRRYHTIGRFSVPKEDKEKQDDSVNSRAYSYTIHETLHAMGFDHIDDETSIMYPCVSYKNRDLSDKDIEMLLKYNQVFYGKTKQAPESKKLNESEEMTF